MALVVTLATTRRQAAAIVLSTEQLEMAESLAA
jgi:hypothetical protein